MLAGIHFFSASAITSKLTSNYFAAFILGIILHHLEDFLPHLDLNIFSDQNKNLGSIKNWNLTMWLLVVGEFIFFFFLTLYFIKNIPAQKFVSILIGGFSSLLPDIISFSIRSFFPQALKFKIIRAYQKFHSGFHFKLKNKNYLLPVLTEILIIIFSLYLLTNINY